MTDNIICLGISFSCTEAFRYVIMGKLRKTYINAMNGNSRLLKAIALSIYVKSIIKSSVVHNYTVNKLHEMTGLHSGTIKKRMSTLKQMGLVEFIGKDKKHLLFKSISSSCAHRNSELPEADMSSVKKIEDCLYAVLMMEIQKRKDFAKHTIQSLTNPSDYDEMKRAKKICNRYGYGKEYKENGLSYKTIAKKLGVCLQKAFSIVTYAIENNFIRKTKRVFGRFVRNAEKAVKFMNKSEYTFATANNIYTVKSNVYSIV